MPDCMIQSSPFTHSWSPLHAQSLRSPQDKHRLNKSPGFQGFVGSTLPIPAGVIQTQHAGLPPR